jgi:hypothetical protein
MSNLQGQRPTPHSCKGHCFKPRLLRLRIKERSGVPSHHKSECRSRILRRQPNGDFRLWAANGRGSRPSHNFVCSRDSFAAYATDGRGRKEGCKQNRKQNSAGHVSSPFTCRRLRTVSAVEADRRGDLPLTSKVSWPANCIYFSKMTRAACQ